MEQDGAARVSSFMKSCIYRRNSSVTCGIPLDFLSPLVTACVVNTISSEMFKITTFSKVYKSLWQ